MHLKTTQIDLLTVDRILAQLQ